MASSVEEEVARDFVCFGQPDAVVVVADATCLERNLNLVLQILEITDKVVGCVNLLDEAKKKKIEIDPQVIQFQCHFKNPIATTLFVNSIILTPSTVTVNVDHNNVFTVHALTVEAAEDLLAGEMQRRIARVFDEFNS